MNCHYVFNCVGHNHKLTSNRLIKETVLKFVKESEFKELFTIAALEKIETVTSSAIAATSSAIKASLDARNAVNDLTVQTIDFVNDAINNTAVEGGVLADTFVTVTANGTGSVARTQRDKNNDIPSIKDFTTLAKAQAAAIENNIKVFIPTGEHEYDLTNADMSLFWGYGQLKDSSTGAIYKPKNGDFVTPKMFGIREGIDETDKITAMSNYATENNLPIVWESGKTYKMRGLSQQVTDSQSVEWRTSGADSVVIECLTDDFSTFVGIKGEVSSSTPVTVRASRGTTEITVSDVDVFNVGDTVIISSSELYEGDNRGLYSKGETNIIKSINKSTKTLTLLKSLRDTYDVSWSFSGTLTDYTDPWNFKIQPSFPITSSQRCTTITSPTNGSFGIISMNTETGAVALDELWRTGFTNVDPNNPSETLYTIKYGCSVKKITSAKVKIDNITLKRSPVLNNEKVFQGLAIEYISDVNMSRNTFINFDYAGTEVRSCGLNVDVYKNTTISANHPELGYGISIIDTSSAEIHGNQSFGCRRCVDVFGVGIIAWDNNVHDNIAHGGGLTSDGREFFPSLNVSNLKFNSGFGSHGGAHNTQYHSNMAVDVAVLYNIRGRDENIYSSQAYGACENLLHLIAGGGTTVDGLYYKDGYSEFGSPDSDSNMPSTLSGLRPGRLINIKGSRLLNSRLPITINNVNANSVTRCAIYLETSEGQTVFPAINFSNISVTVRKDDRDEIFDFIRRNKTAEVGYFLNDMGGNGMFNDQGDFSGFRYTTPTGMLQPPNTFRRIKDSNSYVAIITKDGVIAIPVSMARIIVFSMIDGYDFNARDYECDNIRFRHANMFKGTASPNVEFSDSVLTGTTGTDGKVTISFVGGQFYIENRYLTTIEPLITLEGV